MRAKTNRRVEITAVNGAHKLSGIITWERKRVGDFVVNLIPSGRMQFSSEPENGKYYSRDRQHFCIVVE